MHWMFDDAIDYLTGADAIDLGTDPAGWLRVGNRSHRGSYHMTDVLSDTLLFGVECLPIRLAVIFTRQESVKGFAQ